jgi:tetratricopeptide (TPR) repeat protein
MPSDHTTIQNNQGDVIGIGIGGDGNIISKNVYVFYNEVLNECGLTFLYPNYFNEHKNISKDLEKMLKEGFPFSLTAIYQSIEYKRENKLNDIKKKLENSKRLLILGESGTSKSILLMEMICNYFKEEYSVLYNLGGEQLKNQTAIIDRIKGLSDAKNKILVVVDNVQAQKMSLIFNIINELPSAYVEKDILFLLAARQPEFNWAIERNSFSDSSIIERVEYLFDIRSENKKNNSYTYDIEYFTKDEIKGFLEKYIDYLPTSMKNKPIEENAKDIWEYTNGHPIMVRFSVFQKGLENHVKQVYREFLIVNGRPSRERVKVSILCSLFDISSISITTNLLEDLSLYNTASDLESTFLKYDDDTKIWKTIHPRWDLELLKHLFSITNFRDRKCIDEYFSESIYRLLNLNDDKFNQVNKIGIVESVYVTMAINNFINIDKIDELLNPEEIAQRFDDRGRSSFFIVLGISRGQLGDYPMAIEYLNKALELKKKLGDEKGVSVCYSNMGRAYYEHGEYLKAIESLDKAIELKKKLGDEKGEYGCYLTLAGAYYKLDDFGKFFDSQNKALEIAKRIRDINGELVCYGNLRIAYSKL